MDYRILGPLEVADGDRPVELGGDRQRAVLGQLLLHRNEVVASERLIDELWGERPPPTAGKILQNYVSHLRRALAANGSDGPLETHGRGYRLRVAPGALDLERFERCLESGREALSAGEPERAAAEFRAGLGMWRGPPLPELADTAEARVEIDRILERRVLALEGRVEADLARGRHAELIAELEAAVAREPLRERLRAQLMLALYRSGRQAEALEVHRDGRRLLAEELGLEPGPALSRLERAILEHDPALEPPPAPTPPRRAAREREPGRRWPMLLAAAAILLLAAAAAAVLELGGGATPQAGLATAAPNSVVAIDLASGRIASQTPVGENPGGIAAGSGAVWVLNGDDRTVSRIDPSTRRVTRTFAIGAVPTAVAVGAGGVWIGAGPTTSDPRTQLGAGNMSARAVVRIDGASGETGERITLPKGDAKAFAVGAQRQLAVGEGAVWAVAPDGGVARIDPATNQARTLSRGVDAGALAVGGGSVWALGPRALPCRDDLADRAAQRPRRAQDRRARRRSRCDRLRRRLPVGYRRGRRQGMADRHRPARAAPDHADGGDGTGGPRDRVRAAGRLGDEPVRRHRLAHRPRDQPRQPRHPHAGGAARPRDRGGPCLGHAGGRQWQPGRSDHGPAG